VIANSYHSFVDLIIDAPALKSLRKMPKQDASALRAKLETFAADPYAPHGWAKSLVGVSGVRVRHGDWRAICRIDGTAMIVLVVEVGHRREVYR